MLLLTVHAAAVWALAGISWTVQLVVYPGFLDVGPTGRWTAFHASHSRRIAYVVGPPWAVQGVTCALLLLRRPAGVPLALVLLAGALGLATVVLTVGVAVPLHARLVPYDAAVARRLLRAHALRTTAWTVGGGCATAMLLLAR